MHHHNSSAESLGASIHALTSFLALTQPPAGIPLSRPESIDFVPDIELSRSFHCISTLLSRYHPKRSWECVDIAVTGSLKVDGLTVLAVVKELPDTPDPLHSPMQNGGGSTNGKPHPGVRSTWRVEAVRGGKPSSLSVGVSLKYVLHLHRHATLTVIRFSLSRAPLPYHEYANRLLSTFLAFRDTPSHALLSTLHQIVVNQNVDTLLHLVSLQSKLWDTPLFSLLSHWQPLPTDIEYLKPRAGYYPIDPYISTLLDRCELPKQKPPSLNNEESEFDDGEDNYLLNYETVAKWVHAPAMLFSALHKYLSELSSSSSDPACSAQDQTCPGKESREETLANLVTCLRVLHAYVYKAQAVTDVLFGVPSLNDLVKKASMVGGDGKIHKHRRRKGGSKKGFDEKDSLAGRSLVQSGMGLALTVGYSDLEDSFEEIEDMSVDPWPTDDEDEMEGDTMNEHGLFILIYI